MKSDDNWMYPADERILRDLWENQPDYAPLIATRLGLHLGYVERRVEVLADRGLVAPDSGGVVYAITDQGKAHLIDRDAVADPVD